MPKSQRAVFRGASKTDASEDQKLAAARRQIMGEDAPDASSEPSAQRVPERKTSSDTAKSTTASQNAAESLRERFSAAAKEKEPAVETESDDSDDKPWKRIGSRPKSDDSVAAGTRKRRSPRSQTESRIETELKIATRKTRSATRI